VVERPIQVSADSRVHDVEMARLLLRYGAEVDLTTEDREMPALHIAAESAAPEVVRVLVENGADIYERFPTQYTELVPFHTALVCAANSRSYREGWWDKSYRSKHVSTEETERPSVQIFRYLLDLHQDGNQPALSRLIYRDALVTAARNGRNDFINLLQTADGNVSDRTTEGISPLEAAATASSRAVTTSVLLLELGACPSPTRRPGRLRQQPSALHIAAANGNAALVQLLVDNGAVVNDYISLMSWSDTGVLGHEYWYRTPGDLKAILRHHHTPLQMALHKRLDDGPFSNGKTSTSAIILSSAGAKLEGGELAQAVLFDDEDLVEALLDCGADVNDKDPNDKTALQLAISAGHERTAAVLLRAGAKLIGREVYAALRAGSAGLVDTLLERGADLNGTGPMGETVLEAACSSGCFSLLKGLAAKHVKIRYDSGALCAAVLLGSKAEPNLLDELLQLRAHGMRNPLLEATALSISAYLRQTSTFKRLIDSDVGLRSYCLLPVNDVYESYKSVGLYHRHISSAYEKMGFWHRPNMIRCSPLVPALLSLRWDFVRSLLRAGHRPDPLSLFVAVKVSTPSQIHQLISRGVSPNAYVRHDVDTALQFAVRLQRGDVARLLLTRGADVNGLPAVLVPAVEPGADQQPNPWPPRSALQAAVETGDMELAELLIDRGADVNGPIALDSGASALQLAAMRGLLGIARQLLELGARVNADRAERHGRTALEGAAEMGRLDMVHFLLEQGARITGRGAWQYLRAVGFARRNGHNAVARLLENRRKWNEVDHARYAHPDLLDEDFALDRRPAKKFCAIGGHSTVSSSSSYGSNSETEEDQGKVGYCEDSEEYDDLGNEGNNPQSDDTADNDSS